MKISSNFENYRCQNNRNVKMDDFLQKLKKVVCIVSYGSAISQSDCRKASPYQLPHNKRSKHCSKASQSQISCFLTIFQTVDGNILDTKGTFLNDAETFFMTKSMED